MKSADIGITITAIRLIQIFIDTIITSMPITVVTLVIIWVIDWFSDWFTVSTSLVTLLNISP